MLFKIGATAVGEAWALGTTWRRNARARRGAAGAGARADAPDAGREMQEMHSADGGAAPDEAALAPAPAPERAPAPARVAEQLLQGDEGAELGPATRALLQTLTLGEEAGADEARAEAAAAAREAEAAREAVARARAEAEAAEAALDALSARRSEE